jgi:sugar transferase (PEP-CTERM/EpsH1 system associated)
MTYLGGEHQIDTCMTTTSTPPLVMHVICRLAMGGLENGLVNLINHMPPGRYRHAIVCLTDFTDFRERLCSPAVSVLALHKQPGMDWAIYGKLWTIIRDMKPTIVHTRNLATLEMAALAALARVPYRIHSEHGHDLHDHYGASRKFLIFRKMLRRTVHQYVAVSRDLEQWLTDKVKIAPNKVRQIYNGVDTQIFHPKRSERREILPPSFVNSDQVVIGAVGRLQRVKDHTTLIHGFSTLLKSDPDMAQKVRLVIVGDGPLREDLGQMVCDAHLSNMVWMPGERNDIPGVLQALDIFVLPSESEGISNTILEAMATELPVIAAKVGGNTELVMDGKTGQLIPPKDPEALAMAMLAYVQHPDVMRSHGKAGRLRVEQEFSLHSMVEKYLKLYDGLVGKSQQSSYSQDNVVSV